MPIRYLFLDMNAFFASVEQQYRPELRGKPIAVIPTDAETTACIAASYEAKAFGIKTGTPVWEARKLCRGLICVVADHKRYVIMHNRIVDALGSVLEIDRVMSIDEMSCRLVGNQREPERAALLGYQIKKAIYERAGDHMHCSIGIGPNTMLAKMAADMKKPNGLTVLTDADIPGSLHNLKLQDFPGIGPRMARRLNLYGVFAVQQLCALSVKSLSEVWGSRVMGGRWYRLLRGEDVIDPPGRRQTVSHSHILPPNLRTEHGSYGILVRLAHKAAARLRKIDYWAGGVSIGVSFQDDERSSGGWHSGGWDAGCRVPHCQDTPTILHAVAKLWKQRPPDRVPFKVGVVLADLRPAKSATPSLFEEDRKAAEVSKAIDKVNAEFGASVVHFGAMHGYEHAAPTRIAFTQIPDFDRRVS
ncbi:MAG: DNA polymerase [Planctomycetes bacterium]|nr:DNA polymerase [Planctomycetota bacterium]